MKNRICGICKVNFEHYYRKYCSPQCTSKALSKSKKGDKNPSKRAEVRKKISNTLKGHPCHKEAERCRKLSENNARYWLGKKRSEETKKKFRDAKLKNPTRYWLDKKHSKETIQKIKVARSKQILPLKDTSIEVKIQNFLKQLQIEFESHRYMKEIKHGYQCDIFIKPNIVIECDGDYWHNYPDGTDKDHIRSSEMEKKGFKVFRLWEHEINKMNINDFKNILRGI